MKKTFKYFGLIVISIGFGAFMAIGQQSLPPSGPTVNCWYSAKPEVGSGMYRCGDCAWLVNRTPDEIDTYGECVYEINPI